MTNCFNLPEKGEYGIVCNVIETDRVLRKGAKSWVATQPYFEGRYGFVGLSRGGRIVQKISPLWRFTNFRAAWVPEHLRERVYWHRGTKEEMTILAKALNEAADELRTQHPNRQFK